MSVTLTVPTGKKIGLWSVGFPKTDHWRLSWLETESPDSKVEIRLSPDQAVALLETLLLNEDDIREEAPNEVKT